MEQIRDYSRVAVVIVNYFSEELAAGSIRSIVEAEPVLGQEMEFVIVDNGSEQEWSSVLRGLAKIAVVNSGKNLGFAKAANIGFRATSAEYILLINPDSMVFPGALSRLVGFMQDTDNKAVAILGPKVYDDLAKRAVQLSARSFPGYATALFARYSLLTRLWPTNPWSRRYLQGGWRHDCSSRVDWVSGCCMLVRRSALEQIGMFDERYFMYLEDVDLCRRAWAQGWEVAYLRTAEVVHRIAASSRFHPIRMIVEHHRSAWIYYMKFFRPRMALRAMVFLGIWARAAVAISVAVIGLWARRLARVWRC